MCVCACASVHASSQQYNQHMCPEQFMDLMFEEIYHGRVCACVHVCVHQRCNTNGKGAFVETKSASRGPHTNQHCTLRIN